MSHRSAVLLMLLVTLMWSTAGVVSRHLEAARSFEVTFWRSAFNALALTVLLPMLRGGDYWRRTLPRLRHSPAVLGSGVCWAVMFTAFMLAITMTGVANVLVTMALGPLLTALFARVFLRQTLPRQTWLAIWVASAGIAWMFGHEMSSGSGAWLGMGVALAVPIAAASNWTLLQARAGDGEVDLLPAVWLGALLSALVTLPMAWPFSASMRDLVLLAGLGVFQLALPCLLVVRLAQVLSAAELALLGLMEVLLGVLWAWLLAGESPSSAALLGGVMVLAALIGNELLGAVGRPGRNVER
ncbi:DMT family transporter [Roseateles amylovorans]|uniref:DMT family transporter n=1 Tax=Roseateles amylovorans TaxID=2978473 RepID=A0ABY6AU94_9BURK|nr:DMT family transporter [Roseateles amylovorans]UXH76587.1 DMT family transporter [Roseateles amylovorans]